MVHQQACWGRAWHLVARVGEGRQQASFRALVGIRLWGLPREFVVRGANVLRVGQLVDDCIHGAELVVLLLWARSDYPLVRQKAKVGDLGKTRVGRRLGPRGYLPEQAQPVNREPSALDGQKMSVYPTWWLRVESRWFSRR